MTDPEIEQRSVPCRDCGERTYVGIGRGYEMGEDGALCFNCAIARGGRYDADEDRWTDLPEMGDLRQRPR